MEAEELTSESGASTGGVQVLQLLGSRCLEARKLRQELDGHLRKIWFMYQEQEDVLISSTSLL